MWNKYDKLCVGLCVGSLVAACTIPNIYVVLVISIAVAVTVVYLSFIKEN